MTEKDVAKELGLHTEGRYSDDGYEYILNNSDEWGRVYSILEKHNNITELEDSILNPEEGEFDFIYENIKGEQFLIELTGLFDEDKYHINITRYKE